MGDAADVRFAWPERREALAPVSGGHLSDLASSLETLPALGKAMSCDQFPGAADAGPPCGKGAPIADGE